jgi:hypothetical protein
MDAGWQAREQDGVLIMGMMTLRFELSYCGGKSAGECVGWESTKDAGTGVISNAGASCRDR